MRTVMSGVLQDDECQEPLEAQTLKTAQPMAIQGYVKSPQKPNLQSLRHVDYFATRPDNYTKKNTQGVHSLSNGRDW